MVYREKIIQNYISGYNECSVDKMVADFADNVKFAHVQDGQVLLSLEGLAAFRQQAELAKTYFETRQQTIKSIEHMDDRTEIGVDYHAVLAMDFPNGLKRGQELNLTGKSVFEFLGEKIVQLTDIS